jgi:hypothetical protein
VEFREGGVVRPRGARSQGQGRGEKMREKETKIPEEKLDKGARSMSPCSEHADQEAKLCKRQGFHLDSSAALPPVQAGAMGVSCNGLGLLALWDLSTGT